MAKKSNTMVAEVDQNFTGELPSRTKKRGAAVTLQRVDDEMRKFVMTPEMKQMIATVAKTSIAGRPPKYIEDIENPEIDMPTRMFNLLTDVSQGMRTLKGCAGILGVSTETLQQWKREHERFSVAVEIGRNIQESFAAQRMSQGVTYPTSLIFTMKNLHNWADKIEQTNTFSLVDMLNRHNNQAKQIDWDNDRVIDTNIDPATSQNSQ